MGVDFCNELLKFQPNFQQNIPSTTTEESVGTINGSYLNGLLPLLQSGQKLCCQLTSWTYQHCLVGWGGEGYGLRMVQVTCTLLFEKHYTKLALAARKTKD